MTSVRLGYIFVFVLFIALLLGSWTEGLRIRRPKVARSVVPKVKVTAPRVKVTPPKVKVTAPKVKVIPGKAKPRAKPRPLPRVTHGLPLPKIRPRVTLPRIVIPKVKVPVKQPAPRVAVRTRVRRKVLPRVKVTAPKVKVTRPTVKVTRPKVKVTRQKKVKIPRRKVRKIRLPKIRLPKVRLPKVKKTRIRVAKRVGIAPPKVVRVRPRVTIPRVVIPKVQVPVKPKVTIQRKPLPQVRRILPRVKVTPPKVKVTLPKVKITKGKKKVRTVRVKRTKLSESRKVRNEIVKANNEAKRAKKKAIQEAKVKAVNAAKATSAKIAQEKKQEKELQKVITTVKKSTEKAIDRSSTVIDSFTESMNAISKVRELTEKIISSSNSTSNAEFSYLNQGCYKRLNSFRSEVRSRTVAVDNSPLRAEMAAILALKKRIQQKVEDKHHQKSKIIKLLNDLYMRLKNDYERIVFKLEATSLELANEIDACVIVDHTKISYASLMPIRTLIDDTFLHGALQRVQECQQLLPELKEKLRETRSSLESADFLSQKARIAELEGLTKIKLNQRHDEKPKVLQLLESLRKHLAEEQRSKNEAISKMEKKLDLEEGKCFPNLSNHKVARKAIELTVGATKSLYDLMIGYSLCTRQNTDLSEKINRFQQAIKHHTSAISANVKTLADGKAHLQKLQESNDALHLNLSKLKKKINEKEARIPKLETSAMEYDRKTQTLKEKETEMSELIPGANKERNQLKAQISELEKKQKELQVILEKYKPKVIPEPVNPPRPTRKGSGAKRICWSTGDPHYMSLPYSSDSHVSTTPRRFDVYGWDGDMVLARLDDGKDFDVQTRIDYLPPWANRGLNRALAVRVDGHVFESYGNSIKLDGKNLNIGVGASRDVGRGGFIKRTQANEYHIQAGNGCFVKSSHFSTNVKGKLEYYHNVYVHVPDNLQRFITGICSAEHPTSQNVLKRVRVLPTDPLNMFGIKYVPKNIDHAVHKVHWPNAKLKVDAEDYCHNKLGLTDDLFNDCLMDIKVFGSLEGGKPYEHVKQNLKDIQKENNAITKGNAGTAFKLVGQEIFSLGNIRHLRDDNVPEKLKKELGANNKIAQDVDTTVQALLHELDNARFIQQKLGDLVQKAV